MISRLTGRLVTGPLAFLVCGILDVAGYALAARRRRRGLRPAPGPDPARRR